MDRTRVSYQKFLQKVTQEIWLEILFKRDQPNHVKVPKEKKHNSCETYEWKNLRIFFINLSYHHLKKNIT